MTIQELETHIGIILNTLRLDFKKMAVMKEVSIQFIVEEFGTIVCGFNRADYTFVSKAIEQQFGPGWRVVYISTQDQLLEKKEELIWELMRGGYMTYIRRKYPRQFRGLVTMQNYDKKIIKQRLKVWDGAPRYKFLIDENEAALREAATYILSVDPGFYDYMP